MRIYGNAPRIAGLPERSVKDSGDLSDVGYLGKTEKDILGSRFFSGLE
jgi:hypothetical protein